MADQDVKITKETLRDKVVNGLDELLSNALYRLRASAEQLRMTRAGRRFWIQASEEELEKLKKIYEEDT